MILRASGTIAACAKHFAGYGAVESGRDYATTNIPENEVAQCLSAAVQSGRRCRRSDADDLVQRS